MKTKTTLIITYSLILIAFKQSMAQQVNDVQLYTFAHSLIDNRPPKIATPSDETTILHWIYDISQSSGRTFATTGQFGQLPNHIENLPPNSDLGYDIVPNSWDETMATFANSNLNTVMLTAANFIQYESPSGPDPSDPMGRSIIENTETLFDWTNTEIPNMRYYIYGNWPEMDLQNAYPPTLPLQSEIDDFHDVTIGTSGDFAVWWTDYQDLLMASRPQLNTKLIPAGMVISRILRDLIPNPIPFNELYEDADPHGRANIYFLAGMISYMAMYEENIPAAYMPATIISPVIRNNLEAIRNFAWQELNNFNFPNGDSRVFYNEPLNAQQIETVSNFNIIPNPVENTFSIQTESAGSNDVTIFDVSGSVINTYTNIKKSDAINIEDLKSGLYFLEIKNNKGISTIKLIKK